MRSRKYVLFIGVLRKIAEADSKAKILQEVTKVGRYNLVYPDGSSVSFFNPELRTKVKEIV